MFVFGLEVGFLLVQATMLMEKLAFLNKLNFRFGVDEVRGYVVEVTARWNKRGKWLSAIKFSDCGRYP